MAELTPAGGGPNRPFVVLALGLGGLLILGLIGLGGFFVLQAITRPSVAPTPRLVLATPTRISLLAPTPTPPVADTPTLTNTPPSIQTVIVTQVVTLTLPATVTPIVTPGITTPTPKASPTPTIIIVTGTPIPLPTNTPQPVPTPVSSGQLEITYPDEILFEKVGSVFVVINVIPEVAFVGISPLYGEVVISVKTESQERNRKKIEDRIRIFPFMHADLRAPNFDIITSEANAWQGLTRTEPIVWTWDLSPKKVGPQRITVEIFGSADRNGEVRQMVGSYAREINALDKPFYEKMQDFVGANFGAIVGLMGGGGVLSLIVEYLIKSRAQSEDKKRSGKRK